MKYLRTKAGKEASNMNSGFQIKYLICLILVVHLQLQHVSVTMC